MKVFPIMVITRGLGFAPVVRPVFKVWVLGGDGTSNLQAVNDFSILPRTSSNSGKDHPIGRDGAGLLT